MVGYKIKFTVDNHNYIGTIYDSYIDTYSNGYPRTLYLVKDSSAMIYRIRPSAVIEIYGLDSDYWTLKQPFGNINE